MVGGRVRRAAADARCACDDVCCGVAVDAHGGLSPKQGYALERLGDGQHRSAGHWVELHRIGAVLLRRITWSTSLHEALGQIVFESVTFAIGVALARQFFGGGTREETPDDRQQQNESQNEGKENRLNATLAEMGATLIGAMIISLNIAPTGELEALAAAVTGPWLLGVIAASLVISYALVFVAGFGDQEKRRQQHGIFQHPISETVASYLLALAAGVVMLWFFHRVRWGDPWQLWLHHVVVFGLPTAIGGAAGRLAV